jgi:hypothetical protein
VNRGMNPDRSHPRDPWVVFFAHRKITKNRKKRLRLLTPALWSMHRTAGPPLLCVSQRFRCSILVCAISINQCRCSMQWAIRPIHPTLNLCQRWQNRTFLRLITYGSAIVFFLVCKSIHAYMYVWCVDSDARRGSGSLCQVTGASHH